MNVKLHSSLILKVSQLFVSSRMCKKNLHMMQTVLDPQQGPSEIGTTPIRAFTLKMS